MDIVYSNSGYRFCRLITKNRLHPSVCLSSQWLCICIQVKTSCRMSKEFCKRSIYPVTDETFTNAKRRMTSDNGIGIASEISTFL